MVKWYNHWLIDWLIDNKAFTLDCRLNWKPFISWTRIRCHRLPYHRYLYSVSVLRNVIYRAMLCRAQCCHGKLSVNLSVCLSVMLRYCDHIGWNTLELISPLISLGLGVHSASRIYSKGNTPEFQPEQYWGIEILPLSWRQLNVLFIYRFQLVRGVALPVRKCHCFRQ